MQPRSVWSYVFWVKRLANIAWMFVCSPVVLNLPSMRKNPPVAPDRSTDAATSNSSGPAGFTEQLSCEFQFNQQDIADATGMTDVHTNRTLHALRRDGLISLSFRSLKILDWQGLKDEGEFSERYLHHAA